MNDIYRSNDIEVIKRIRFHRSIPNVINQNKKLYFQIIICDEFNVSSEEINNFTIQTYFYLINCQKSRTSLNINELTAINPISIDIYQNIAKLCIMTPDIVGNYHLVINVIPSTTDILVLPLISDVISIINEKILNTNISLICYRFIPDPSILSNIIIKEEYGANLGSHIYDSSIVLLRYLKLNIESFGLNKRIAIELGAGCGLVSIWLSNFYERVICTDKEFQLSIASENIQFNNVK